MSLHELTANNIDGKPTSLADYKGKVLLVVNVASQCGYTPQYTGLEKLWQDYKSKGVVVVGLSLQRLRRARAGHRARNQNLLLDEILGDLPALRQSQNPRRRPIARVSLPHRQHGEPKWNFHKYVVGKDGQVRAAFPSKVAPDDAQLRAALDAALRE